MEINAPNIVGGVVIAVLDYQYACIYVRHAHMSV